MVAILILNWNGYKDTIECLESLQNVRDCEFSILIGDNGSVDNSIEKIEDYCISNQHEYRILDLATPAPKIDSNSINILDLKENHGFAKGNNIMIKYISSNNPDYILLLNNDTVVEPDFLSQLINYMDNHKDISAITPLITLFNPKDIVWNAGGKLFFGFRKYNYPYKPLKSIKEKGFLPCSFITGCALMFRPSLLQENGNLLTEKFFFGEEDFELCLRLKRNKQKIGCLIYSRIHHKVGSSKKKFSKLPTIFYLNRLINMKNYLNKFQYQLFRVINLILILRVVVRHNNLTLIEGLKYSLKILSLSSLLNEIDFNSFITLSSMQKEEFLKVSIDSLKYT